MLDQKLWNLNPDFFSYTLSKAALETANQLMARAFAPALRVVGVAPGPIDTPGVQEQMAPLKKGGLDIDAAIAANPLRMAGQPDHIARVTLFLVSDLAVFLTGQTVVVDGGATA